MMYQTRTVAEWAAMVSLASSGYASFSVFYFLLVESTSARDFDPRRPLDTRAADRVLVEIVRAKGTTRAAADRARHAPRDAAVTAAALYMLLTATPGDFR